MRISVDYSNLLKLQIRNLFVAIYSNKIVFAFALVIIQKHSNSPGHGKQASLQDIDGLNLFNGRFCDSAMCVLMYGFGKALPLLA